VSPHVSPGPGQHARTAHPLRGSVARPEAVRKAKPEAWQAYREAIKHHNLSRRFVETMGQLRLELDLAGGEKKILVLAVDGSFCNRTCLRAPRTVRS